MDEDETEEPLVFPHRLAIDDQCDTCGATSGICVAFGYAKPIICEGCIRRGLATLERRAS